MPDLLLATVPRGYVHRTSVAEVLLTGWEALPSDDGEPSDAFVVRAQWPRSHAVFAPVMGRQDPLLLVESIRQAGLLLSHAEYGVPLGYQFLMRDISFTATDDAFAHDAVPTDVELLTTCHDIVRRGGVLVGMRYEVSVRRADRIVAAGGARFTCTSPAVYERLRGGRNQVAHRPSPTPPLAPELVGRTSQEHVLLAAPTTAPDERSRRWELRVDTGHPVFFDHEVDHVPGMLLIEAARQAVRAATRRPDGHLITLECTFSRYAELSAPCWVEVTTAGDQQLMAAATQDGERVFTAILGLAGLGAAPNGAGQDLACARF